MQSRVLIRAGERLGEKNVMLHTDRRRVGGSVTTEAEIFITEPEIKKCQEPPEGRRGKEQILLCRPC